MEGTYAKIRLSVLQGRSSHVRERIRRRFLSERQRWVNDKHKEERDALERSFRRYIHSPFAENVFLRSELGVVESRLKKRSKGKRTLPSRVATQLSKELSKEFNTPRLHLLTKKTRLPK